MEGKGRHGAVVAAVPPHVATGRRLPVLREAVHGQPWDRAVPPATGPGRGAGPQPASGSRERRGGSGRAGWAAGSGARRLPHAFSPQWAPRLCGSGLRLFVHVANTVSRGEGPGKKGGKSWGCLGNCRQVVALCVLSGSPCPPPRVGCCGEGGSWPLVEGVTSGFEHGGPEADLKYGIQPPLAFLRHEGIRVLQPSRVGVFGKGLKAAVLPLLSSGGLWRASEPAG